MLSIIIVNYNVKYFIEQCLYSVQSAIAGIAAEVIVIDNNSADESVAHLQEKFSWITVIANRENKGFAWANNQGVQLARGEYILFLNPDTILAEDCLTKSIHVLQQDRAGAMGIRMIDGTGRFLPESKRGIPTPKTSFFKLSGLIKAFPQNKTVARYYLGWLPEKEDHEVEVLSGAYMMVKKEVLEKTGGFDEQFFMYGEDIDLSYRIRQAGYKNYYLGSVTIIHFKGESTKKDIRYTRLFYTAMNTFVQKHYAKRSRVFAQLMRAAIAVSGKISSAGSFFMRRPAVLPPAMTHTILAGEPMVTKKAAAILAGDGTVKRILTCVTHLTDISSVIQSARATEIVFCAGTLRYADIIHCMDNLNQDMDYKFFTANSDGIVGSVSRNSSGQVVV